MERVELPRAGEKPTLRARKMSSRGILPMRTGSARCWHLCPVFSLRLSGVNDCAGGVRVPFVRPGTLRHHCLPVQP